MKTALIILLILNVIFLICSIVLFYKAKKIELIKNIQQEQYKEDLFRQLCYLQQQKEQLNNSQLKKRNEIDNDLNQWQEYRKKEIDTYLKNRQQLIDQQLKTAQFKTQQEIANIHTDLQNIRYSAQQEKEQIQNEIEKLRASLSAGVQARLREQQIKQQMDFYKLSISDADLSDVKMLENLKVSFHKPVVLSKLIWTQYFQKQMTELCDRVLGKKVICGIYKITNALTEQCYIGQSVNVSDRWKQHCKCGLGIQASATNILYNAMQKDGVWNFTFELLEQCPKEQLNEKEAFWINTYQSNKFGYNGNKGVIK